MEVVFSTPGCYAAEVDESDEAVRVELTAEGSCRRRALRLELDEPLGERPLVEVGPDRVQPVFDRLLLEPASLPEGYELLQGGPYPEGGWQRVFGTERCAPVVLVVQGGPALAGAYPRNGAVPVATHEVRGARVPYERSPDGATSVLAWNEGGGSVVVASQRACAEEEPLPEEALVALARSLR